METSITAPTADARQGAQADADRVVVCPATAITHRGPIHSEDCARPPFAHLKFASQMSDGFSLYGGRHHFFEAISLSMALSSIASASSFFSLPGWHRRTFDRLASCPTISPFVQSRALAERPEPGRLTGQPAGLYGDATKASAVSCQTWGDLRARCLGLEWGSTT